MKNEYEEAVAGGIESISRLMFAELMILTAIDALGSIAICLLFWPRLMFVFALEAIFAIATIIIARQIIWRLTTQIDSISDGIQEFSDDPSFRFDAQDGSIEYSMNMWMDSVATAEDVNTDLQSIDDEAKRIELIADGMLSGIVPRDADMILEIRSSSNHIQDVISSRAE